MVSENVHFREIPEIWETPTNRQLFCETVGIPFLYFYVTLYKHNNTNTHVMHVS
jgi:hypothetical protein